MKPDADDVWLERKTSKDGIFRIEVIMADMPLK
jgi:hypothetical protein